MANNPAERQPRSGEGTPQPDATDLGPNEQTVLSQQMAPNRTPSDQVEALRGAGSVGRGDEPTPALPHDPHGESSAAANGADSASRGGRPGDDNPAREP